MSAHRGPAGAYGPPILFVQNEDEATEEASMEAEARLVRLARLPQSEPGSELGYAVDLECELDSTVLFFDETELGVLDALAAAMGADARCRGLVLCIVAARGLGGPLGPLSLRGPPGPLNRDPDAGVLGALAALGTLARALECAPSANRVVTSVLELAENQGAGGPVRVSLTRRRTRARARQPF